MGPLGLPGQASRTPGFRVPRSVALHPWLSCLNEKVVFPQELSWQTTQFATKKNIFSK